MKILFIGLRYFYDKSAGLKENSFEYNNFYLSLLQLPGTEVIYYPTERLDEVSINQIRSELFNIINKDKPNCLIFVLNPFFDKETFREITKGKKLTTIGIITDDDAGFFDSWQHWANCFNWIVTFYPPAVKWHRKLGEKVIGVNWACNPECYKPIEGLTKDIDVSFIGRGGPQRKELIDKIERAGIKVNCFGADWEGGVVSYDRMREIFSRSKINLNFSGQPLHSFFRPKSLLKLFLRKKQNPDGDQKVILDIKNIKGNFLTLKNMLNPMTRARVFEILATKSFLLTGRSSNFGTPFIEGKEIVSFNNIRDLTKKIKYYLRNGTEREKIAEAGHERVIRDHTLERRFKYIFDIINKNHE